MNLTVTTFSLFETTKEERVELAKSVLSNIEEGSADPRKVLLQLKSMEDLSVRIKDDPGFRRIVVEESSKFGKSHEFMNSKFEVKEVGTKYDYSNCNDSVYDYLLAQKETIDKKVKERESFLKITYLKMSRFNPNQ